MVLLIRCNTCDEVLCTVELPESATEQQIELAKQAYQHSEEDHVGTVCEVEDA